MSFTLTECHVIIIGSLSDKQSQAILTVMMRLDLQVPVALSLIDGPALIQESLGADDSAQTRLDPLGRIVRFCNR